MFGMGFGELILIVFILLVIATPVLLVVALVRKSQRRAESVRKTGRFPRNTPPS